MRDRFIVAIAVLAATSAFCPSARAACTASKIDLPVTMQGRSALVHTQIDGVDETFVVDSGAFYSTITPATVDALHLPKLPMPDGMRIDGLGGLAFGNYITTVPNLTIAGQVVHGIEFLVSPGLGGRAGLFGQNILGLKDVEYDLKGGMVRLVTPEGDCAHTVLAFWVRDRNYSVASIDSREGFRDHTVGDAFVNGAKVRVLFDTGAPITLLSRKAALDAGVKLDGPDVKPNSIVRGIDGNPVKSWSAPVADFKLGGEEIRNTRLIVADFDPVANEADMILGADFFLAHHVYVANSQFKIYFTYNGGPIFDDRRTDSDAKGPE
ncbi:MAG TPA: retropepsin-like aspartic protease [Caulobacteraceae bacterium]|nr:retropepsin-like aspartic protease [Caulobacteraceae bacterium]